MTYTKQFQPARYEPIRELTNKLEALEPGQVAKLTGLDHESISNARWLIYDYLSHTAPGLFRVRCLFDQGTIEVRRKGFTGTEVTIEQEAPIGSAERELLEELILIPDEDQVETELRQAAKQGRITARAAAEILDQWRRANS